MIFPVAIQIGLLVPVILISLLWLLNFVFVLNVLGLWRILLVSDSFVVLVVCVFLFFCFLVLVWLVDSMF